MPIPESGSGGGWPADAQRKGNKTMQRKYRLMREAAYAQGVAEFNDLAAVPTFREFISLYIAEGNKRNRNRVEICNSDSTVMRMSVRWLRRLSEKPMGFSIQYHADQDLDALRAFWAITLSIPADSIKLQRKSNSSQLEKRTWRSVHGSCRPSSMTRCCAHACRHGWIGSEKNGSKIAALGAWRSLVSRSVWGRKAAGSNPAAPILDLL